MALLKGQAGRDEILNAVKRIEAQLSRQEAAGDAKS